MSHSSVCYTNKYLLETSCKHVFCYECLSKWFLKNKLSLLQEKSTV